MEALRGLYMGVLAALLILAGCLGGGVIDDTEGQDGDTGTDDTVTDGDSSANFPLIQSLVGDGTISTSAGEYVEILDVWWKSSDSWRDNGASTVDFTVSCSTVLGSIFSSMVSEGDYLPSDGQGCDYTFSSDNHDDFNIIYRIRN